MGESLENNMAVFFNQDVKTNNLSQASPQAELLPHERSHYYIGDL